LKRKVKTRSDRMYLRLCLTEKPKLRANFHWRAAFLDAARSRGWPCTTHASATLPSRSTRILTCTTASERTTVMAVAGYSGFTRFTTAFRRAWDTTRGLWLEKLQSGASD